MELSVYRAAVELWIGKNFRFQRMKGTAREPRLIDVTRYSSVGTIP